jgi:hypothetical protein
MSDRKSAQRATEWNRLHPERCKANKIAAKERKHKDNEESLRLLEKRKKGNTPVAAIKMYCRCTCNKGKSRGCFLNAPVTCSDKKCFLYPFRNGDPVRVRVAMNLGEEHISHMQAGRKVS